MEFKMDLRVIVFQKARNSFKRVRRNGEGKTDLLCTKWFLTRHCVLRTVLTFSHTSWSHYSKVFFVKGKGGKRTSRSFSAGGGRAWADPERVGEPTTERNQRKTPARRQQAWRKQKRDNDRQPQEGQTSKTKQKMQLKMNWAIENTDIATETRNFYGPPFFDSPVFFHFPLPAVSQIFCERWDFRKRRNR